MRVCFGRHAFESEPARCLTAQHQCGIRAASHDRQRRGHPSLRNFLHLGLSLDHGLSDDPHLHVTDDHIWINTRWITHPFSTIWTHMLLHASRL